MIDDLEKITNYFNIIRKLNKLDITYCVVFVYNDENSVRDLLHLSECILDDELIMIQNAFRQVADYVYAYNDEIKFLQNIDTLKKKHKYICVYSMAQNVSGIGRRSFIPLICDYFNLINIGAGFMPSTLGGNKQLMYTLTTMEKNIQYPFTFYICSDHDIQKFLKHPLQGKYLLKPNDESASIGLKVYEAKDFNKQLLKDYRKKYPIFCVQEFIEGEEVAVPLIYLQEEYLCPGISKVVFKNNRTYLDYDTVALEQYDFIEYNGQLINQLISMSKTVAKKLDFHAISRIDFRIKNGKEIYIEDIGPNPTISEGNGVNKIFSNKLDTTPSCIYILLLFIALEKHKLFKPSLN